MDRGLARVVVVRVHHEFHMKHLLPPTHLHERLRFPWPVSIRGWTLRISSSKRLRDSLITSSLGSTLRALQVLPLHRHHHQTHRCLFMFSYITWSRFLILIVYHIYIYIIFLFISCVFSRVYDSFALPFLWQKGRDHWTFNSLKYGVDP